MPPARPPLQAQTALPVESVGHGIDLVLLHGWGLHSEFFRPWLPLLSGRARVHLIDLPAHGLSEPCSPFTLTEMADAVAAAMQPLAPRYAVAGWSLGGAVALRMALDRPLAISHVITLASAPRFLRATDWTHAAPAHALALLHGGLKRDFAATVAQFFELNLGPRFRQYENELASLAIARPAAQSDWLDDGLALTLGIDLRAEVAEIRAPLLAISGRLDRLSYSQSSAWLAQACGGHHIDLPHAAHVPHLSNPIECATAVLNHLQRSVSDERP
jgi:pimeloyl-[acyl-carrier protein] methyl ester esterase